MGYSQSDVVEHYEHLEQTVAELTRSCMMLASRCDESIMQLSEARLEARLRLAQAYLPTLDASAIARVKRLTGFSGFQRRDPLKAMARQRATLEKGIARIEADPRYQRRVGLVGPAGELTLKLAEARDMLEPFEAACAAFESQPLFDQLYASGYDTPHFDKSWYQLDYWRFWAAGDRICAALGMDDFGDDVLPAYEAPRAERGFWRQEVARVEALVDAVHALVAEHDRALATLPRLPEMVLQQAHEMLAEFFEHADLPLLAHWLAEDGPEHREIEMPLRALAGSDAKLEYATQIRVQALGTLLGDLGERSARYQRKRSKYARSKHAYGRFGERDFDRKFETKSEKHRLRIDRLGMLLERLLRFDDYARFDVATAPPQLWWLTATGKRPPRLLPGLRTWYDQHPDATAPRAADDDADELPAAAIALLVEESSDADYIS